MLPPKHPPIYGNTATSYTAASDKPMITVSSNHALLQPSVNTGHTFEKRFFIP